MNTRRLLLFSGMGGDSRLMRPIQIHGIEVVTPDHAEPRAGEDLVGYASRVAKLQGIGPADVVGGASFGGMLAAEIARQRAPEHPFISTARPMAFLADYAGGRRVPCGHG